MTEPDLRGASDKIKANRSTFPARPQDVGFSVWAVHLCYQPMMVRSTFHHPSPRHPIQGPSSHFTEVGEKARSAVLLFPLNTLVGSNCQAEQFKQDTMKSSVATATQPSRKPEKRTLTVRAEDKEANVQTGHDNDHDRFFWTYTEEPHRTRRMAIIKAHPEVCS